MKKGSFLLVVCLACCVMSMVSVVRAEGEMAEVAVVSGEARMLISGQEERPDREYVSPGGRYGRDRPGLVRRAYF